MNTPLINKNNFFLLLLGLMLPVTALAADATIGQMLTNLSQSYPGIINFIKASSYVIGLWFFVVFFYKLKRYGQMRTMMMSHVNITGPLTYLMVGAILFYLPSMMDVAVYTFFGTSSIAKYPDIANPEWSSIVDPIIMMVRIVGYVAFLRGWLTWAKMAREGAQPGTFAKGAMFIIGGVFCINIVGTINLVENTLLGNIT